MPTTQVNSARILLIGCTGILLPFAVFSPWERGQKRMHHRVRDRIMHVQVTGGFIDDTMTLKFVKLNCSDYHKIQSFPPINQLNPKWSFHKSKLLSSCSLPIIINLSIIGRQPGLTSRPSSSRRRDRHCEASGEGFLALPVRGSPGSRGV